MNGLFSITRSGRHKIESRLNNLKTGFNSYLWRRLRLRLSFFKFLDIGLLLCDVIKNESAKAAKVMTSQKFSTCMVRMAKKEPLPAI